MGLNVAGLAAGYQGFQDEQRRIKDDEQRAKAGQRQEQDALFQEEMRNRQRKDWARNDKNQALDEADLLELREHLDKAQQESQATRLVPLAAGLQKTPVDKLPVEVASVRKLDALKAEAPMQASGNVMPPVNTGTNKPPIIPAVGGIPQPRNFNSVLDMQSEVLNRRLARGTLSTQDYAQSVAAINKIKSEGIHQALELMADGDYQAGVDAYNTVGRMRGARVVEGKPGVTKLSNGQEVPTHFVTIQNADGTRTTMDVARARYQLLDFDKQLIHQDAAAKNQMQRDQHADQMKLSYTKFDQESKAAAAALGAQARQLALMQQKFYAETPAGMIAAREQALGRKLTDDQKATMLGIDLMPQALKMQVSSIMKEQEQLAQTINKAMADGSWQPLIKGDKDDKGIPNPLLVRQNALNGQLSSLLNPKASSSNNALGIYSSSANSTSVQTKSNPATPLLPAVGGISRPSAPVAPLVPLTPVTAVTNPKEDFATRQQRVLKRFADIRNDPQLQALLRQSEAAIARGQRVASNNALQRYNDLLAERYPPL